MLGTCSGFILVACLLAGCLLNKGARESSSRQAITPARYDEGKLATNHNTATEERGYNNTSVGYIALPVRPFSQPLQRKGGTTTLVLVIKHYPLDHLVSAD